MKTIATQATPQATEETSFRLFLRAELARRCARNPRYSLRSFARQLGVDHATLSQLLRGRRALTAAAIDRLGTRLKLDEKRIEIYRVSARREGRRYPSAGEARRLTQDAANVMADWCHFAILELVRLRSFRPDSRWIARVLDIGVDEVNMALQRLLRLGLLEMPERGRWVDRSGPSTASLEDFTQAAVQRLFEQLRRLEHDSVKRTAGRAEWSSTTLAVNTARIAAASARLARFQRELIAFLEQDTEKNEVYRIDIGLFPVTRIGTDGASSGR
jgi:transcriptional regulator with XRE-family HTH domain